MIFLVCFNSKWSLNILSVQRNYLICKLNLYRNFGLLNFKLNRLSKKKKCFYLFLTGSTLFQTRSVVNIRVQTRSIVNIRVRKWCWILHKTELLSVKRYVDCFVMPSDERITVVSNNYVVIFRISLNEFDEHMS